MAPSSYLKTLGQTSREWVKLSDPKQALRGRQPMLIHRLSRIFEASRARGFVLRSEELQILSFIWEIQYPNLIDQRLSLSILNKRLRIHIVREICEVFVDLKLAIRQDLGFIPSGNVVLSSTYVGKILGADQLLVILCYRYQESGIGYWILSMTISGSGVTFLPSCCNGSGVTFLPSELNGAKIEHWSLLLIMHFSVSLLLTPLCCDDIHDVTPRVSALAGCDRLVSEPSNMKRPTKGFSCQEVALFPTMLDIPAPSTSPSRITSSPSPTPSQSSEPTLAHTPSPTQPSPTQPSPTQPSPSQPGPEHQVPTPHDSPLHAVHSHGSDEGSLKLQELMNLVTTLSDRIGVLEADLVKTKKTYSSAYTKLILRVKKLESQIKIGKARKQARVVLSDDEAFEDDSSKQGRKLFDEEVQEKASTDTELFIQEVTPTEVIQDQEGSEKASDVTAEVDISTAGGTVTYVRRSAEKRSRQDKGKAIMFEEEPKKKSKKELEQERLSYAEAIRLEEQMNEEQRAQIARDEEIARQWDEEERKRAMDEAKTTKKIDWNDPSVIRYHSLKMKPKTIAQARRNMIKYLKNQGNFKISNFKGMSYNDIRPIFEKIWDFNQNIEPMDTEHGSGKQKSPQKSPDKSPAKEKSPEKFVEEEKVVKEPGTKRKKSIPRKSTRKRQKMEEDSEKEELKEFLDIIPREEGDGSSKNYKIFTEMLRDFDRHDVEELYRLVKERYRDSSPEGYDLMLWGDLHTMFDPDEEDEIWKDQHEYKLLSWRLCDFCGIHILLMENGLAIHMLTEKKYPLSQEMLTKMLSKKLEVDHESSQAFELLRFIRSQVQK
ncbi:hypothetical protein Tco_1243624 [Tanacetum coccineum]